MSVLQVVLIALFYALARSSFTAGLGMTVFGQPLVAGALTGLILGDPTRGVTLGAALNLGTLGLSILRARWGPDIALIGYVGVPILMISGAKPDSAQGLAVIAGLGAIGVVINFLAGSFNTVLTHWADYFAERGEPRMMVFLNVVPAQVFLFLLTFFPAMGLLLGPEIAGIAAWSARVPDWLTYLMTLFQRLLLLLGIAMALRAAGGGSAIAYAVLGWLAAQLVDDQGAAFRVLALVGMGGAIAVIHAFVARRAASSELVPLSLEPATRAVMSTDPERVPPPSLTASFLLWQFFNGASTNFERGQNLGLASALSPVVLALYPDRDARTAALRRHLSLFLTEPTLGAGLVGALAAAEARVASGDVSDADSELVGGKVGAMAVTGALGDNLVAGLLTALMVSIGAGMGLQGSLLGPLVFIVLQSAVVLGGAWLAFRAGHRWARSGLAWAHDHEWLRAGGFAALRLGAFMLGAFVIRLVALSFPSAVVVVEGARMSFQGYLDALLPRAIPLVITAWMWWQLRTRRLSPTALAGLCGAGALIVTGVMKALGWL